MGKVLCDSSAMAGTLQVPSSILPWTDPTDPTSITVDSPLEDADAWETVGGLEDQQKRYLQRLHNKGVFWNHPDSTVKVSSVFRLSHGGDVDADGNCLFTALRKAMESNIDAKELRKRTVNRFLEDLGTGNLEKNLIEAAIRHLYSPDWKAGWGIHVVQEVKLLAIKADRESLDMAISELVNLGLQRESTAESIYKERCIAVNDCPSWATYMSISGSSDDEFDIITFQYTEEGLLTVHENRDGHAAAFGDDIAIESLATEFKREIYVVQAWIGCNG